MQNPRLQQELRRGSMVRVETEPKRSSPTRSQLTSRFCRAWVLCCQQFASNSQLRILAVERRTRCPEDSDDTTKTGSRSPPPRPVLPVATRLRKIRKPSSTRPLSRGQPRTSDAGPQSPHHSQCFDNGDSPVRRTAVRLGVITWQGLMLAGVTLVVAFSVGMGWHGSEGEGLRQATTLAFMTLALTQVFHAFNARSQKRSAFTRRLFTNGWLWAAVVACLALQAAAVYLRFCNGYFTLLRPVCPTGA